MYIKSTDLNNCLKSIRIDHGHFTTLKKIHKTFQLRPYIVSTDHCIIDVWCKGHRLILAHTHTWSFVIRFCLGKIEFRLEIWRKVRKAVRVLVRTTPVPHIHHRNISCVLFSHYQGIRNDQHRFTLFYNVQFIKVSHDARNLFFWLCCQES
jgi:hypothetical protein